MSDDVSAASDPTAAAAPFSLSPAMAHHGIINYSTTAGRKMYSSAKARLSEDLYNCNSDDLMRNVLLQNL